MSIAPTRIWRSALCLLGLCASLAAAAADDRGEDHPALNRYPGARIAGHDYKEFEEFQLILSRPKRSGNDITADKLLPLEGQVTYIHYEMPDAASTLQVFRNYQSALKRSGFKELFVCERPCVDTNLSALDGLMKARGLYLNGFQENQYLAAQRGETYVALWVNRLNQTNAWLFVVDKQRLDDGRIGVSGNSALARALNESGRADVYGFQFDTGKAQLKPASRATLDELAQVLSENPELKLELIGHTDNVGGEAANQTLSEARAAAVASALSAEKGIDGARLSTSGRGQSEPVAGNDKEADRAKNRRVEVRVQIPAVSATTPRAAQGGNTAGSSKAKGKSDGNAESGTSAKQAVDEAINTANKLKNLIGW